MSSLDVLILNSGEWVLGEQLPATPWHILIYRERHEPRNELHVWLPLKGRDRAPGFAFRRYWVEGVIRWCIELPSEPKDVRGMHPAGARGWPLRFTGPGRQVLWAHLDGLGRLADLTDDELLRLRRGATPGPYFGIR